MSKSAIMRKSVLAGALISIGAPFLTATKAYEPTAKVEMP